MIIELHLTGNERKGLAKAVSEIIGAPSEYQYMPTCIQNRQRLHDYKGRQS